MGSTKNRNAYKSGLFQNHHIQKTSWILEYESIKVNVYKLFERLYNNVRGRKPKLNSSLAIPPDQK